MIRNWTLTRASDGKGLLLYVGIGPDGEPHYAAVTRAEALAAIEDLARWVRESERG